MNTLYQHSKGSKFIIGSKANSPTELLEYLDTIVHCQQKRILLYQNMTGRNIYLSQPIVYIQRFYQNFELVPPLFTHPPPSNDFMMCSFVSTDFFSPPPPTSPHHIAHHSFPRFTQGCLQRFYVYLKAKLYSKMPLEYLNPK